MPKIRDLEIGQRFRYPDSGVFATLVRLGESGASVKLERAARVVKIGDVEFESPGRPVVVSSGTDVELA